MPEAVPEPIVERLDKGKENPDTQNKLDQLQQEVEINEQRVRELYRDVLRGIREDFLPALHALYKRQDARETFMAFPERYNRMHPWTVAETEKKYEQKINRASYPSLARPYAPSYSPRSASLEQIKELAQDLQYDLGKMIPYMRAAEESQVGELEELLKITEGLLALFPQNSEKKTS